nr:PREDICTED: putative defensin-like protein 263 [Raphanus sativus]
MEKTSLKLVFLFSLTIIVFCMLLPLETMFSWSDAREMVNEEVNCLGGNCPDGKNNCNCLPPVAPVMNSYQTNASCRRDNECIKYCPKGCKIVNCNFGTCFCEC